MTRVYQNPKAPTPAEARMRALILGGGRYPHAKGAKPKRPQLTDLTSVGPSVREFVGKLMHDWRDDLEVPLDSVDLLLCETAQPGGSTWSTLGVPGEVAAGTPIDEPTLQNVNAAVTAWLQGAKVEDHLLFLCCGHGFWKSHTYFVLSDFGATPNAWANTIDLDGFRLGLRQEKPRNQWLFFDCCSDIGDQVLTNLSNIGDPLIPADAVELAKANKLGALAQFGFSSSSPGQQAFGIPNKPSRFCEMLVEAVEGAGAVAKSGGKWWVDDRGIADALRSYPRRKPDLANAKFYTFATPISNDMPLRMRFRAIAHEPLSCFVAFSNPKPAMTAAAVVVTQDGKAQPILNQNPAGRAKLHIELPARGNCKVAATFGGGPPRVIDVYGSLPVAEPEHEEFIP